MGKDLLVCPTVCDLGSLGQAAGGIALASCVPDFLLVNILVCKPACYLGFSLVEPHKNSLSAGHSPHQSPQRLEAIRFVVCWVAVTSWLRC